MINQNQSIENMIKALREIRQREVISATRSAIDQSMTEYIRLAKVDIRQQLSSAEESVPARNLNARFRRVRTSQSRLSSKVDIGTLPFNPISFSGIRDTGRTRRGRRGRAGQGVRGRGGLSFPESFIAKAPNSGKRLVFTRTSQQRGPLKVERIAIATQVKTAKDKIGNQVQGPMLTQKFHAELQKRIAKYTR